MDLLAKLFSILLTEMHPVGRVTSLKFFLIRLSFHWIITKLEQKIIAAIGYIFSLNGKRHDLQDCLKSKVQFLIKNRSMLLSLK